MVLYGGKREVWGCMCLGWRGNKWSARDNPPFAAPPCSLKCVASLASPKLLQTHSHVRYFFD